MFQYWGAPKISAVIISTNHDLSTHTQCSLNETNKIQKAHALHLIVLFLNTFLNSRSILSSEALETILESTVRSGCGTVHIFQLVSNSVLKFHRRSFVSILSRNNGAELNTHEGQHAKADGIQGQSRTSCC